MTVMAIRPRQTTSKQQADQDQIHAPTRAELLAIAAADLVAVLGDLVTYGRLVRELLDTNQPASGLVSEQTLQATDKRVRAERADRVDLTPRAPGLQWMRGTMGADASGPVHTVGNTNAISVDAQLTYALQHGRQRLIRALTRAGLCPLFRLPADHTVGDLVAQLRGLVTVVVDYELRDGLALVNSIRSDLEHIRDRAERLVDGERRVPLPAACIHCGRKTLTADAKTLTVRCDRTARGNKPCQCSRPICDCRRDPINHEHEWPKPAPGLGANTWHQLISGINARERARDTSPTTQQNRGAQ